MLGGRTAARSPQGEDQTADTGATPGSWIYGAASVPRALPDVVLARARAAADAVDPGHLIRRSRLLG